MLSERMNEWWSLGESVVSWGHHWRCVPVESTLVWTQWDLKSNRKSSTFCFHQNALGFYNTAPASALRLLSGSAIQQGAVVQCKDLAAKQRSACKVPTIYSPWACEVVCKMIIMILASQDCAKNPSMLSKPSVKGLYCFYANLLC